MHGEPCKKLNLATSIACIEYSSHDVSINGQGSEVGVPSGL